MRANCPLRQGALVPKERCHSCRHYERGEELWIWHCQAPKRPHTYVPVSDEVAEENVARIKKMLLSRQKEEDKVDERRAT